MIRDLRHQNKYSWWRTVLYSWVSWCSSVYKKAKGFLAKATWIPRSLANKRVLCWNKLPKWVLFHEWMFAINASRRRGNLDKEDEAEGISSEAFQLSCIKEWKVGSMSHICSNQKGLEGFCSKGSVLSKIGQWSDLTLGGWWISTIGKSIVHSALPNPLSNRSLMVVCHTEILLV